MTFTKPDEVPVCRTHPDPEIWFPKQAADARGAEAKELCEGCPLRQRCLDFALKEQKRLGRPHVHGIWGGVDFTPRSLKDAEDDAA